MSEREEAPGLVEQLRDAIRRSGQSLNQLSKASGVGSNQLSRFMRGVRTLTLPAAEKLCRVLRLRLSPEEGEGPPAPAPKKRGKGKGE
jgi:transcriptional regulator with XRE-family HTH domain